MESTIRNTKFDNLVNYQTQESNLINFITPVQSSSDPTSLAFLTQNNLIIDYHLVQQSEIKNQQETIT